MNDAIAQLQRDVNALTIVSEPTEKPKHAGGRPLKFSTVKALQEAIDEFFDSCWDETGKQIRPYTMTGLALALDTSRKVLVEYSDREEFRNAISRARLMCENYLEEGMITGKIPAAAGVFNAKNNYGWVDKSEVDNTNRNFNVVEYIQEVEKRNSALRQLS